MILRSPNLARASPSLARRARISLARRVRITSLARRARIAGRSLARLRATRALALGALIGALALGLGGCSKPPPALPPSVVADAERGPIQFKVEASPSEVWIGDPVTLSLTATLPGELVAGFPTAADLGGARVRDEKSADPLPGTEGRTVWRHTFTLEFLTSGEKEIPPLVLKYGPRPAASQPASFENELAANTLKITVRSALTSQDSLAAPRDITGVRTPSPPPMTPREIALIAGSIIAGLLLTAAATWWIIRAIRKPPPPLSPEAWALRELSSLAGKDWLAVGETREYYYRMSEIVRAYIERKFGLRAPEMTTEEFITTLARDRTRLPVDSAGLREFMQRCDLIKYAAFAPTSDDAAAALQTARSFVETSAAAWAAIQAAQNPASAVTARSRAEGKAA